MREVPALILPSNAMTLEGLPLATWVEPRQVAAWMQTAIAWPRDTVLKNVEYRRVWPTRNGGCNVEWELLVGTRELAERFLLQGGAADRVPLTTQRTQPRMTRHGLSELRLNDSSTGLWCCSPDRDDELSSVRSLLKLQTSTLVAYRARKRCVVFEAPNQTGRAGVFHKVYRRALLRERVAYLRWLRLELSQRSAGRVQVPEILDYSVPDRRIVLNEVPPPCRQWSFDSADTTLAGNVLAELHAVTKDASLSIHSAQDEWATVARWFGMTTAMWLADDASFPESLERLAAIMPADNSDQVVVHRDFFPSQLKWRQESVWLLDFDTMCLGHAEVDFGTYIAHVYLDRLRHGSGNANVGGILQEIRTSYEVQGGRLDAFRLRYYLACALFRLSAIQRTRHEKPGVVGALWRAASMLAAGDADRLGA